jgi:hypothetical protein
VEYKVAMMGQMRFVAASNLREGVLSVRPDGVPTELLGENGGFEAIANIMLLLIGAVAVIMLLIGGIRYVISGGDSNAVQGAKNTILYAIIGIVVAFLAFAAINFLTQQLMQTT